MCDADSPKIIKINQFKTQFKKRRQGFDNFKTSENIQFFKIIGDKIKIFLFA